MASSSRTVLEADAFKPGGSHFNGLGFGLAEAGRADDAEERIARSAVEPVVLGDDEVFEDRHAGEETDVLEGAGDLGGGRDFGIGHAL